MILQVSEEVIAIKELLHPVSLHDEKKRAIDGQIHDFAQAIVNNTAKRLRDIPV